MVRNFFIWDTYTLVKQTPNLIGTTWTETFLPVGSHPVLTTERGPETLAWHWSLSFGLLLLLWMVQIINIKFHQQDKILDCFLQRNICFASYCMYIYILILYWVTLSHYNILVLVFAELRYEKDISLTGYLL